MYVDIEDRIKELSDDRLHGAGWLSLYAIDTLIISIEKDTSTDIPGFLKQINNIKNKISRVRSNMVSISNYLDLFYSEIKHLSSTCDGLQSFKKAVQEKGRLFKDRMEMNSALAAGNCSNIIGNGDRIITCSYSSLLIRALITVRKNKTDFEVVICKSLSSGISYGTAIEKELAKYNIKTRLIEDREIDFQIKDCTSVITGADTVLHNSAIINGVPTKRLADATVQNQIPYYVVCENAKFDINNFVDSNKMEDGFDLIQPELYTALITESGIIKSHNLTGHFNYLKTLFQTIYENKTE